MTASAIWPVIEVVNPVNVVKLRLGNGYIYTVYIVIHHKSAKSGESGHPSLENPWGWFMVLTVTFSIVGAAVRMNAWHRR
jgi:hypothetical protein